MKQMTVIAVIAILVGFTADLLIGLALYVGISPRVLGIIVVTISGAMWFYSNRIPLAIPIYKFVLPVTLPVLGIIDSGILGFILSYAIALFLQYLNEKERLFLMEYKITHGINVLGRVPADTILWRTIFSHVLAGILMAIILLGEAGEAVRDMDTGLFTSSVQISLSLNQALIFGSIGAGLAFLRYSFEIFASYLTASRIWGYPGSRY